MGKNPETRSLSAAKGYRILSACEENKRVLQDLSKQINQLAQLPSMGKCPSFHLVQFLFTLVGFHSGNNVQQLAHVL
jgi:hypothetical protein